MQSAKVLGSLFMVQFLEPGRTILRRTAKLTALELSLTKHLSLANRRGQFLRNNWHHKKIRFTIWYPRPGLPYEVIWSFFDDFAQQPVCPLGPNKFEILRSSKVSMNKSLQAEYNRQKIFHNFFIQTMLNRKSNNTTMNTFILLTNMIFICNILQNCMNFYCFVMAILPYHYVIPYEISLPSHTLYYSVWNNIA